jgi:hypothetical protein
MTIHHLAVSHEVTADYCVLMAEAAHVLSSLVNAEAGERAEDLADLTAIHAEGDDFPRSPGMPDTLRDTFESIVTLGQRVAVSPQPLPEAMQAQVPLVETMARALSLGMDDPYAEATVHEQIDIINRTVAALGYPGARATDLLEAARLAAESVRTMITRVG